MRTLPRRLLQIAAGLLSLLVILVLALPYLVSLDAVRNRVVAQAEAALHRKVEVGKVRLQILSGPGAGLEKLVVHNGPGFESPALISADKVSIKVAFWPLLARRVEVRRVALDGVAISLERTAEGGLNVSDFVSAGGRDSPAASQTAAAALAVSRIDIARGRLQFVDRKVSPGRTVITALEDLTGTISDLGPATPARFDLSARLLSEKERNLALSGTFGPPRPDAPVGQAPLKAKFEVKKLALKPLAPYVAAFQAADPGFFWLSGTVEGAPLGTLAIAARVELEPGAGSPIPPLDGTAMLSLDWPTGRLAIADSLLSVANLPLKITGRVDGLRAATRVKLSLATPGDVDIDDVTGFPGLAGRLPAGVKLAGKARFDAKIEGPASALETKAELDAAPFSVEMDGKPMLAAPSVRADFTVHGSAPMSGTISATSGKLRDVAFQDLRTEWTWKAGALTLAPSARVYGGTLSGRIASDFAHAGSASHIAFYLRSVDARALLESATTYKNVLSGRIDGKIEIESRGLSWDAVSRTGRGEGRIAVTDPDLLTLELMPEVARALSAVGRFTGYQVPESLKSTTFTTLETSLKMADGKVETPDLTLSGRDVAAVADGAFGFDKTLAYRGRIVLGPALVKSLGSAGRYVADSEGRLVLPFEVSGPIVSPSVSIDHAVVVEIGRRILARAVGDRLGGTAGKLLGDALGKSEPGKPSGLDLLQQLMGQRPRPTPTPR